MKRLPWLDETLAANGEPVHSNFASWFRESRVVLPDGTPRVVYHGTQADFDIFTHTRDGTFGYGGIYFCDRADVASDYALSRGANVVPVFLSIQKPYIITSDREDISAASLEAYGYDGIYWVHPEDGPTWVAFNPEQVKSAIANSGLYLRNDASLTDRAAAERLEQAKLAKAHLHLHKPGVLP